MVDMGLGTSFSLATVAHVWIFEGALLRDQLYITTNDHYANIFPRVCSRLYRVISRRDASAEW